jgi:glycosyltransferase involved in cell wall biosynthesis
VSNKFLSVIIPAYNEEKRLGASLEQIGQFLATKTYTSEILVVDDGSIDATIEVASQYVKNFQELGVSLRIIQNPVNCGKGYTIRNGMLQALGEIAMFTDADLSTPITELDQLIAPIVVGEKDIVFGSRALPESKIATHQPTLRETAGRVFNQLMKVITGLPYQDTQCGFKAFHRNRTSWIFEKQKIFGFAFDVEVLFIAQKHGLRCLELPIIWADVAGTKVSMIKGLLAFLELALIRWHYLLGHYTPSAEVTSTVRADT